MKDILLDMDEVVTDFFGGALSALNKAYDRDVTAEQFVTQYGGWDMDKYYGLTQEQFWAPINNNPTFWIDLEPIPWATEIYRRLSKLGRVTIVTAPSNDPNCSKQKLQWLDKHLGIKSDAVFLGHRKFLMAGNGILIDDRAKNVDSFVVNGGDAILVPAQWNTLGLTFDQVWSVIEKQL